MAYSTPYDYNEESIEQLDEKFSEIDHDRFLYCIQDQQKWDIEKVNKIIAQLRTCHIYAMKELERLRKLEPIYNKDFPIGISTPELASSFHILAGVNLSKMLTSVFLYCVRLRLILSNMSSNVVSGNFSVLNHSSCGIL